MVPKLLEPPRSWIKSFKGTAKWHYDGTNRENEDSLYPSLCSIAEPAVAH